MCHFEDILLRKSSNIETIYIYTVLRMASYQIFLTLHMSRVMSISIFTYDNSADSPNIYIWRMARIRAWRRRLRPLATLADDWSVPPPYHGESGPPRSSRSPTRLSCKPVYEKVTLYFSYFFGTISHIILSQIFSLFFLHIRIDLKIFFCLMNG